jgi:hypothetical protein
MGETTTVTATTYESISIVYLPGTEMQNATVVASSSLTM